MYQIVTKIVKFLQVPVRYGVVEVLINTTNLTKHHPHDARETSPLEKVGCLCLERS